MGRSSGAPLPAGLASQGALLAPRRLHVWLAVMFRGDKIPDLQMGCELPETWRDAK